MKANLLAVTDPILREPQLIGDEGGFFFEVFNHAQSKGYVGIRGPNGLIPQFSAEDQAIWSVAQVEDFS